MLKCSLLLSLYMVISLQMLRLLSLTLYILYFSLFFSSYRYFIHRIGLPLFYHCIYHAGNNSHRLAFFVVCLSSIDKNKINKNIKHARGTHLLFVQSPLQVKLQFKIHFLNYFPSESQLCAIAAKEEKRRITCIAESQNHCF